MSLSAPDTTHFEQFINQLSQLPAHTIGRGIDNTILLPNKKISSHHAHLIACTNTCFILEDHDSKNGTFVNSLRITRKVIDRNDKISLADTDYTVDQLLALVQTVSPKPIELRPLEIPIRKVVSTTKSVDFSQEFAELKQVYEQYPKLRRDCRNREKMVRTGSVILSSIVGVSAVLTTGGGALPLIQVMSGAGLSMLIPTLCSTLLSTDEKLEIIDKEYRERYRCPNPDCRDPFLGREWNFLAQQKSCRRCQAIWVN